MSGVDRITAIVNDIMRVEAIESAFSDLIRYNSENEEAKIKGWQEELNTAMSRLPAEQQVAAVIEYLILSSRETNYKRLEILFGLLESLITSNVLSARMVSEVILNCDRLVHEFSYFWIECFTFIKKIINKVDYKGVREIMKGCLDKVKTIPKLLDESVQSQLKALESLLDIIFDRNACLLPSYFIITEIVKLYPENKNYPHWRLAKLMSDFVETFRPVAQMVSITGHSKMLPVVTCCLINPWLLDSTSLKFSLKGNLPYDSEYLKSQSELLRYVLEQSYSRDMVCSMLGLQKHNKQRCIALEEQIVELVILAMERFENNSVRPSDGVEGSIENHWFWLHLSSQFIYFIFFQFACFRSIVIAIHEKLAARDLRKGRDHLMWVLLQFISGSIQRNPLANFLPVLKLCDLLYPEKVPLPVPDSNQALSTHQMAVTCIWIHLLKKAQLENANYYLSIPTALKAHHEYLLNLVTSKTPLCVRSDYKVALLCNAFSTYQEYFGRPMAALVDAVLGTQKQDPTQQSPSTSLQSSSVSSLGPVTPLTMSFLDSLTVHSKMSLIHSIVSFIMKLAQTKSTLTLASVSVETYSRLLVYTEIENLGIKGFINQLLPHVFKTQAWGTLFILLELFSYRVHHIQPHYRVQILSHLHSLATSPQTNQTQLHCCVESTTVRMIMGLGSFEIQPQLSRFLSDQQTLVSSESEELNRVLVLTLAISMHVTSTSVDSVNGTWCKELLNTVMQNTPHLWATHTLQCFPPVVSEFFEQNFIPLENNQLIKKAVDEEYRNWSSMNNENDIITHFSDSGKPPLFLCLLWKMILEIDAITPISYKILERIGARALSAHLRKFCDYLIYEFANNSGNGEHVNKCVDTINHMIWKYNFVTIDRLILCLALRPQEGNEAKVCFFIIQLLLLKAVEFRNRVQEFVKENSPEHWKYSDWHEKHSAFHQKYPETFVPGDIMEQTSGECNQYKSLPVYFGNICLKFLPVFDVIVHRYLEIPQVNKSLEVVLDHLGCLYKFHDRPVTYLYNTLHYYETKLRDRPLLKRRLVAAVLGSFKEIRPPTWALSELFLQYMSQNSDETESWIPELDYYIRLVRRMVETMTGVLHFSSFDWRFNEFPNPAAHVLYVTCVELMAVPVAPNLVANNILDVVAKGSVVIPPKDIHLWINCIGLLIAALPECYWVAFYDRLVETTKSPGLVKWQYHNLTPFRLFNFNIIYNCLFENKYSYMLALAHSIWHHASVGQLTKMPQFIKEKLQPVINSEEQLIFACSLIGPTLVRFNAEKHSCILQLSSSLYEMLEQVDKSQSNLKYIDPVCDLLYHIKYMFIGDLMKTDVDCIIRRLRPELQMKLRFITHLTIEEIPSGS